MEAKFTSIDQDKWERKKYFDYYYYMIKTKYNLNKNIDITALYEDIQRYKLRFYPTMLYIITKAVNQNKEFRISFDENGTLGYWNYVNPAYTIFHDDDKTFSDIWSYYDDDFPTFYNMACLDMETYKDVKEIKARSDQPANFCLISCLPWLSFDGFAQDTFSESSLLFPFIRFGKYYDQNGKKVLPLSIFVNHSVADGYHACKLINDIQDITNKRISWM